MMESEQSEANASNLINFDDEALHPSVDEEHKSATDVESDLIGGAVDGSSSVHTEPTASHEQVDQEQLIKFEASGQDVHDILQPQTVKIGFKEGSAEGQSHQDRGNAAFGEQINVSAASDEQIPQRVSIDDEWGSPQKRLRYETDGTGFGTDDNDDDDDDDNGHGTRYVLEPQEISIHVGADTYLRFGVQDNDDNRYILESQNDAQIVEHESPELQFEQEEEEEEEDDDDDDDRDDDHYILQPQNVAPDVLESPALQFEDDDDGGDVADEDRYIRHYRPSATDAEQKPLDLQFETGDDDDNRYLPQSQTAYSVKQEMNLENKDEKIDLRFILQSENVAEDDAEQVSPELLFEPDEEGGDDVDENRYNRLFQPVALETDVMIMQEFPELQFEPDDEDEDGDDDDENRYNRLAPETDVMVKQESPELQCLSDNVAVDVEDDNNVDADDGNRYVASPTGYDEPGHSVAYEQQFHDTSAASAVATADDEDDVEDDNDADDGNRYIASPFGYDEPGHSVAYEQQFQDTSAASAVATADDKDNDDDDDDDDDDDALDLHTRDNVSETSAGGQGGLDLHGLYSRSVGADGEDNGDNDDHDDDDALDLHPRDIASESSAGGQGALELQYGLYAPSLGADGEEDDDGSGYDIPTVGSQNYEQPEADQYQRGSYPAEEDEDDESRYITPSRSEVQESTAGGEYDSQEQQQHQRGYYASHYDGEEGDNQYIAPENAVDYEQPSPEPQYQHGIYDEDGDNDGSSRDVDFEQGYQEDHHRHGDHTVYEAEDENDESDNGYIGLSIHAAQNKQQHQQSFKDSLGGANDDEDDDGRYTMTPTNNEFQYDQKTRESEQRLEPYYEGDGVDDNGINDNPRLLIKGILSEDSVDETHDANVCDDDDDDEDDTGDAIDIRDNTNVEDQFIEFEENSFVEAAVSNVISDENFSGEREDSKEESVGDGDGANEQTFEAGAVGGGDANHVKDDGVAAGASSSRVTFADEIDLRREHRYGHYHDGDGDGDDYHIIPGLYKQGSHDSDERNYSEEEEKSLDVLLLEEICEEAASMTIKEALIHSLKPNVRAGLTTAHLKLSESEVLALEGYCEEFVGGLIKDLLKRSSLLDLASGAKQTVVKASVIKSTAKQLSAMEVQQLKLYCDHFVHNVIAESIIDSSMIVARQQHQAEQVKEVLHLFQNSEELQEYFTNLTTDIVRAALLNVTAKDEMEADNQEDEDIKSRECEATQSMEQRNYLGPDQDFENQDDDFDFDSTPSFGFPLRDDGSSEYRSSRSQESWPSEDKGEMGTRESERTTAKYAGRSPYGNTSLEFDEEWAEGVIQNIGASTDGEKRQKIVMRELDFDDRANVGGTELLAPVFLAVAEDNEDDTEFEGLRRRTQSIEDLCDLIEEEKEPPRKRASSLTQPKRKPRKKPRPRSYHEQMEELNKEAIHEDTVQNTSEPLSLQLYAEPEEVSQSMSSDTPSSPKTSSEKSFYAYDDERYRWHTIRVNNREKVLDLKLIEPYMKVITHGGVHTPSRAVIVVIAACYLPDKTKRNYEFLMEQLFFYLISTLELLATTDEYFLVYFNGGSTQSNQPALPWMRRFYQHIEGGLKKHMINMFIVHPNFWLKTVVRFAKAFVGTNFWSKLQFIKSLDELSTKIPVEFIYVPDEVIRSDPKYKRVHNL